MGRALLVDVLRDGGGPPVAEEALYRRHNGGVTDGAVGIADAVDLPPDALANHQLEHVEAKAVFRQDFQLHVVGVGAAQAAALVVHHGLVVLLAQALHNLAFVPHPLARLKVVVENQHVHQGRRLAGLDLIGVGVAHAQGVDRVLLPHMGNGVADKSPHRFLLGPEGLHVLGLGVQQVAELRLLGVEGDKVGGVVAGLVGNVPEEQAGLAAHRLVHVVKELVGQVVILRL